MIGFQSVHLTYYQLLLFLHSNKLEISKCPIEVQVQVSKHSNGDSKISTGTSNTIGEYAHCWCLWSTTSESLAILSIIQQTHVTNCGKFEPELT